MNLNCPNCGHQFAAMIDTVIDPSRDPQAKVRLLSGQANVVRCPNCGAGIGVATPLVYHDAARELLITFIPPEMNMPRPQQEKLVGDMLRDVMGQIPNEQKRGYLFNPRQALTMQGLVDQILQADGITPEMLEQQRARVRLLEQLLQTPGDALPQAVRDHDSAIDSQFMQTLALMLQSAAAQGQTTAAEQLAALQQAIMQESSYGRELLALQEQQAATLEAVATDLQALGDQPTHAQLVDVAIRYADDDQKLQAMVGLARPIFDYAFFSELTGRIDAAHGDMQAKLTTLRTRIQQLTEVIDRETQAAAQDAVQLLQILLDSPEQEQLIRENVPLFDDLFMQVLTANLQDAERRGSLDAAARLRALYEKIVDVLREQMQPELRFLNDLLGAPDDATARALIAEQAPAFGPGLVQIFDAVSEMMAQRGQQAIADRLNLLRNEVTAVVGQR
jgi:hypothetical protein